MVLKPFSLNLAPCALSLLLMIMLASDPVVAGADAGFGVDQELTGNDHALAFSQAVQDLGIRTRFQSWMNTPDAEGLIVILHTTRPRLPLRISASVRTDQQGFLSDRRRIDRLAQSPV